MKNTYYLSEDQINNIINIFSSHDWCIDNEWAVCKNCKLGQRRDFIKQIINKKLDSTWFIANEDMLMCKELQIKNIIK